MKSKTVDLSVSLSGKELSELIETHHLNDEDLSILEALQNELQEKQQCKCCYYLEGMTGYVVITLGETIDVLQKYYSENDGLYEALLLNYLASELLNKAYQICNELFEKETGLFVKEYQFPGTELPHSDVSRICELCQQSIVTYNDVYTISPKQSTVFQVVFTDNQEEKFCSVCTNCGNKECTRRKVEDCKGKEDNGTFIPLF